MFGKAAPAATGHLAPSIKLTQEDQARKSHPPGQQIPQCLLAPMKHLARWSAKLGNYLAKGVALDIPVAPARGARTGDVCYLAEFTSVGAFGELLL